METEFVYSDPFNMTIVSNKTSNDKINYNDYQVPSDVIEGRIAQIKNYFKKSKNSKETLNNICKNLNFYKEKFCNFYGGGRLLLDFCLWVSLVKMSKKLLIITFL